MKDWIQGQDLKLFRVFYELTKAGGFAQAQVQLNISQSSLSTYISQLETRVGMRLCSRGHAGFKLTEDGQNLFDEISVLLDSMETFATRVTNSKSDISGKLSLGILENSLTHPEQRLVRALAELQERAPSAIINIYSGGALELETRVLDGRLQGAVGLFPHKIDGLDYQPLFSENHYLYCAKKHPLALSKNETTNLEELTKYNYINREYVDEIEGLIPPEQFIFTAIARHMEGLILLLLTGKYFGYLPDHTAAPWVERGKLVRINAPGSERTGQFMIVKRKDKQQTRAMMELLSILSEV